MTTRLNGSPRRTARRLARTGVASQAQAVNRMKTARPPRKDAVPTHMVSGRTTELLSRPRKLATLEPARAQHPGPDTSGSEWRAGATGMRGGRLEPGVSRGTGDVRPSAEPDGGTKRRRPTGRPDTAQAKPPEPDHGVPDGNQELLYFTAVACETHEGGCFYAQDREKRYQITGTLCTRRLPEDGTDQAKGVRDDYKTRQLWRCAMLNARYI
ncbi:hypothetical protein F4780DRAFT_776238 [Xylariomycetidae sp. FL0641]|nr:hypothetical protein F4780DRAFT_776238 [Xylariomycetidae sp. FL0641]